MLPMSDGEQIVEVVRHAAGELANRLDPLRLTKRGLGTISLRHLLHCLLMFLFSSVLRGTRFAQQRFHLFRAARQQQ